MGSLQDNSGAVSDKYYGIKLNSLGTSWKQYFCWLRWILQPDAKIL